MRRRSSRVSAAARASPWPILAAAGLATAELGILTGYVPVAIGGGVLLGGGVAGLLSETGYGATPAGPLVAIGGVFVAIGGGLWMLRASSLTVSALRVAPGGDGIARRGLAILAAGCLLVVLGVVISRASTVEP